MTKNSWLATAAAVALTAGGTASAQETASATGADDTSTTVLGEIVITARRVDEKLQDVPLTVTAFDDRALQSAGIENLRDIAGLTPGLNFDDLASGLFGAPIIRGLSQSNFTGPRNVSTFLDGVYISDPAAVDLGLIDLARVEVVKGPVSALYGRNAFAGAINYVSKAPSQSLSGFAEGEYGSHGKARIAAGVSGPLVRDVLGVRISGAYDDFDGTYSDPVNDKNLGGYRKRGVSGRLRWTPSEASELTLRALYSDDNLLSSPVVRLPNNCGRATPTGPDRLFCGTIPEADAFTIQSTSSDLITGTQRELTLLSANFNYDFGPVSVNAIVGHNDVNIYSFNDYDRTRDGELFALRSATAPFAPLAGQTARLNSATGQASDTKETSYELRLVSDQQRSFKWSVGGYYFKSEFFTSTLFGIDTSRLPAGTTLGTVSLPGAAASLARIQAVLSNPSGGPIDAGLRSRSNLDTEAKSAFATAEYELARGLTLRGEARYTDEQRTVDIPFNSIGFANSLGTNGRPVVNSGKASWDFWNYRATTEWKATEDVLIYASVATGTNGGGFNGGALSAIDFAYSPEKNTTYEIGAKTAFAEDRAVFNIAAFQIDWTNAQILSPPLTTGALGNVVRNTGEIESKGFEAELAIRFTETLSANIGYSYTDATFGAGAFDFNAPAVAACQATPSCAPRVAVVTGPNGLPFTGIRLAGIQTPRQSKNQFNASLNADVPVSDAWTLFGRADLSIDSGQSVISSALERIGKRDTLNLRLGARSESVSVTGYVDNVFDDRQASNAIGNQVSLSTFVPNQDAVFHQGRTYGIRVRYSF
jgi:iron complex outermembrane recepter protein